MKKYNVHISFEANIDIVAESEYDAEKKAWNILNNRSVVDEFGNVDYDFIEQEPNVVEKHEINKEK